MDLPLSEAKATIAVRLASSNHKEHHSPARSPYTFLKGRSGDEIETIRVLYVLGRMQQGGIETRLVDLMRRLQPEEFVSMYARSQARADLWTTMFEPLVTK
jgi:hypothetical protein